MDNLAVADSELEKQPQTTTPVLKQGLGVYVFTLVRCMREYMNTIGDAKPPLWYIDDMVQE